VCSRAVGEVTGLTFGGRDYDFTTPGALAVSESPVLSQTCVRIGKSGGPSQAAFWLSFDAMPLLVHSYGRFGARSPVWVEAALGAGRRYGRHIFGLEVVTNSVALGIGARWVMRLPEKQDHPAPSFELKLAYYPAIDPEVRATVLMHFESMHFDPRRNPMTPLGRSTSSEEAPLPPPTPPVAPTPWPTTPDWPDHWTDPADPDAPTWGPEPDDDAPPVIIPTPQVVEEPPDRPEPHVRPTFGFEVGSMMGLRADVAWLKHGSLGLRVGSLTSFRSDSLLQPTALVTGSLGSSVGAAFSFGTTRHDNVWMPVGGVAFVVGPTARLRLHVGVAFGRDFLAPDVATVILW
jgi:hypothetical protein